MEFVAIICAVALIPNDKTVEIFADNQAAINLYNHIQNTPTYQLLKSPLAFLLLQTRSWLSGRSNITLTWTRGHNGNLGNEMADHYAKKAHNEPNVPIFTYQLPKMENYRAFPTYQQKVVLKKIRTICKKQDNYICNSRIMLQLNEAAKYHSNHQQHTGIEDIVNDVPLLEPKTLDILLQAINCSSDNMRSSQNTIHTNFQNNQFK